MVFLSPLGSETGDWALFRIQNLWPAAVERTLAKASWLQHGKTWYPTPQCRFPLWPGGASAVAGDARYGTDACPPSLAQDFVCGQRKCRLKMNQISQETEAGGEGGLPGLVWYLWMWKRTAPVVLMEDKFDTPLERIRMSCGDFLFWWSSEHFSFCLFSHRFHI